MDAFQITVVSIISLAVLGFFSGALLAAAARIFAVKVDPRVEEVMAALPGSNCGACGYAGCRAYAEAVIAGANPALCRLGGEEVTKNVARLVGTANYKITNDKATILCGAGRALCEERSAYLGEMTCRANTNAAGGSSACAFGCLTYGDCIKVCPVDAISPNGILPPIIDRQKCIGCGKCVAQCPRDIIILDDAKHRTYVLCASADKGPFVKRICKRGCIACRICVTACPAGTMTMEGRIPEVHYEKGEPTEECIGKCPQGTIVQYK